MSDSDYNRLYAIKKQQGKDHLSGNEFAKELLERTLHKMHPQPVEEEEDK